MSDGANHDLLTAFKTNLYFWVAGNRHRWRFWLMSQCQEFTEGNCTRDQSMAAWPEASESHPSLSRTRGINPHCFAWINTHRHTHTLHYCGNTTGQNLTVPKCCLSFWRWDHYRSSLQVEIRACWTASSAAGPRLTYPSICPSSTTWAASPSTPTCRHSSSKCHSHSGWLVLTWNWYFRGSEQNSHNTRKASSKQIPDHMSILLLGDMDTGLSVGFGVLPTAEARSQLGTGYFQTVSVCILACRVLWASCWSGSPPPSSLPPVCRPLSSNAIKFLGWVFPQGWLTRICCWFVCMAVSQNNILS